MMRVVKAGELFATFNYDGKDCADMGIYNITSGAVYTMNIEPAFTDHKLEVPAYDGKYYYGTQITGQQFQFTCFCHDLLTTEYDRMRAWLNPRKIGRLILSDQPYKYYLVKPVSVSTLGAYPLTTVQTPLRSVLSDFMGGDVVYTGNFTITFETVGSAYGYGLSYYRDDLIYDAKDVYGVDFYYNSGLLYKDMNPKLKWEIEANAVNQDIPLFNPGSAVAQPIYHVSNSGDLADNTYIQINNANMGTSTVIDVGGISGEFDIDTVSQTITDSQGKAYHGRFSGTKMEIDVRPEVIELPETFVENIEDSDLKEYDTFYIENNVVSINPSILSVTEDLIGKYFCVCLNGGSQIKSVNVEENSITLDPNVTTYDIVPALFEEDILVHPSGMPFNYIEVGDKMPTAPGEIGDVCVVNDEWFVYLYDEWRPCNLFSNKEDFQNQDGDYETVWRVFGATIVPLDKITITTGTNINYKKPDSTIATGASMPAFTLEAGLQPRYL